MLARRRIFPAFHRWNRRWGAPSGYRWFLRLPGKERLKNRIPRLAGRFGFQINNTTRRFEYPWTYLATPLREGMRALEIGGGLSGFQFVLAKSGLRVTNVDPGEKAEGVGWPVTEKHHEGTRGCSSPRWTSSWTSSPFPAALETDTAGISISAGRSRIPGSC